MTGDRPIMWCGCSALDDRHRCDLDRTRFEQGYSTGSGALPPDLADLPIGQRVAAIRKLRSLTQAGLAARLHRSESWVTKIERGERRLDSIEVLQDLSRALAVPLPQLTGHAGVGLDASRPSRDANLAGLGRVLGRPALASPVAGGQVSLRELARDVSALRRRYNRAPHNISALLAGDLTGLVTRAQAAVGTVPPADRALAYAALSELYRLAALALRHLGELALGRVAIDRAMSAAEQADDLLRVGAAGAFLTLHLGVQGEAADGLAIAMELARVLARDPRMATPAGMVVLGGLQNYAALVAAHAGEEAEARRLLAAAHGIAARLRRDRGAYGVFFGPGNLAIMEHAVMADLGHAKAAVRTAEQVPTDDLVRRLWSVCRASKHHLWLARAYSVSGQDDEALATIAAGVRVAPEMVGEHPYARALVRNALRRRRRVGEQLRRLAREIGVLD